MVTQYVADGIWAMQEQLVAHWLWEGSSGHHFLIKMSRICLSLLSSVFLPHTECSTLWWPVRDVTLQWNPSQRISPAALHLTVLCAFPVCFYDFTVSQHLYRMSASTFVCFIDCNLGCLTSWRFLYLNLKAKFACLVKCTLDSILLSCIAGSVYMGQPQMQFTPQGYATAVAGSIPPTTTMMGAGVSGMALPNGGYMSMQQGAMPANQGQNMYSMQQGQWNMGQVTGRNINLCIKVQSEWWLTFSFLPTPVAVNI